MHLIPASQFPSTFELWHITPTLPNGWAILGELDKWVPLASARVQEVIVSSSQVSLVLSGAPNETVTLTFWDGNLTRDAICPFGSATTIRLDVPFDGASATCTPHATW
mmetsp:Transcript_70119/g.164983  ORF Transcript_70119/g.164983 Transcript_70119/m.164983 type:complete len:108 (+) Transcript_70119:830-1153(+)